MKRQRQCAAPGRRSDDKGQRGTPGLCVADPARPVLLAWALLVSVVLFSAACGGAAPAEDSETTAPSVASTSAQTPIASVADAGTTAVTSSTTAGIPTTAEVPTTASQATSTIAGSPVTVTVLYDNTAAVAGLHTGHGFSCLVTGLGQTVLFDTGVDGAALLANMEALGVTPVDIAVVVLSHDHDDHTGGLARFVAENPDVAVYYPATFAKGTVAVAREAGATLMPVGEADSICPGLTVTAPTGSPAESGLLVHTPRGPVLLVGCAHPGVVEMAAAATGIAGEPVFAVLGGFHLASKSGSQVDRVAEGLKDLGVQRCGPAHCTGERAIAQIREAFGEGAILMGVGATVTF